MDIKSIVQTEGYRELEKRFYVKAKDIKEAKIDRTKPYEEQGREAHANELASNIIINTVKMIRKEIDNKFRSDKSYE